MPYTMEDFRREYLRDHVGELTPEERLEGLSPEQRLKGLSPEERVRGLSQKSMKTLLKYLQDRERPHKRKKNGRS